MKKQRLNAIKSGYARSLIEASRDPLFTINTQGKITDINNASINIFKVSREKLIGSDFFEYFTDPKKARDIYKQIFSKGFVIDFPLKLNNSEQTEVLFNGSVYLDDLGKVIGVVVVARDITDHKRIENELKEAIVMAEIATLIAEDAKLKAEKATRIAEDAMKAKQQFLSNMSHEIRTPMNAIIGFTKVVLKTDVTIRQKEYLSAIKLSGDALIVLINDILDLAKVDAGKMTFELIPFKMSLSISAMLHLFEMKIQEKNLKLIREYDSNIPLVLVGDPVRLHQILTNLLSNAAKFTSKGTIKVSAILLSEDDSEAKIEFSVSDTGIGIAKEKITRIFENFQQATSATSRLYGGTGLGLSIVKQLVELQGGTISVKSKVNEGSTFSFVLTFSKTTKEAISEVDTFELDAEIKNLNLLVVEDIPLNQLLMKTLLDEFGFESDMAMNGKIALDMIRSKSYDLILMDLQMPEMNGFEATDYIRNTLNLKVPIIALTADVTTVDREKCKAIGMDDYISKPIDEKILYNKIVSLAKKSEMHHSSDILLSDNTQVSKAKCTNLDFLKRRTKSNADLMMEMLSLYLEQTPPLVKAMKEGLAKKDWKLLHSAVHKMIPSFSIMGIDTEFENMAKKIQDYANTQQQTDKIPDMVLQIENLCNQSITELKAEHKKLKRKNK